MTRISCIPMTREAALLAYPLIRTLYPSISLEQWQRRLGGLIARCVHDGPHEAPHYEAIIALRGRYVRGVFTYALVAMNAGASRLEIRDFCVMDMLDGDDVLGALVQSIKNLVKDLGASESRVYLTSAQQRAARILVSEGFDIHTLPEETGPEEILLTWSDKVVTI